MACYQRLALHERIGIRLELDHDPDVAWAHIGRALDRTASTVRREVERNGGRDTYDPDIAQRRAQISRPRRQPKLVTDPALAEAVAADLRAGYSPAGCSHRIGGVSTETIYQAIYTGILGVRAVDVLRTRRHRRRGRNSRRHRPDTHVLGRFRPISTRPAVVDARTEFGHWEGDLIIGAGNKSALITLNERCTRTQVVLDLPNGYGAERVADRLSAWVGTVAHNELRSLTWDRGSEMAQWENLRAVWGLDVFFCDPHSPWQRGQNEHGNRQLRFWLPKGTDLRVHTQRHLDAITTVLNTQPRRLLGWDTPAE